MKTHEFEFDYYFEEIDKTLTLTGKAKVQISYNVGGPSEYVRWFWAQVDASELFEQAIQAAIYNEICKPYKEENENN